VNEPREGEEDADAVPPFAPASSRTSGSGSGPRPPTGGGGLGGRAVSGTNRLTTLAAVVAVAVLVVLWRIHHIASSQLIYFLVLVPSIILHEVSHGFVASRLGDDTARRAGRLTLNPLAHVDLFGTILLPVVLVLTAGVAFGYAKPVPVNPGRLRHPRNGSVAVALAGPLVNIVLFVLAALAFRLAASNQVLLGPGPSGLPLLYEVLLMAGVANLWIAAFNLIPLPPLDGSALVERLVPTRSLGRYLRLRPYGMVIVVLFSLLVLRNPAVGSHLVNGAVSAFSTLAG
jgi:Zn-dependent protease